MIAGPGTTGVGAAAGAATGGAGGGAGSVCFISDCHVSAAEPEKTRRLLAFLARVRGGPPVRALYVLGDLFEYWIGPAQLSLPDHRALLAALRDTVNAGVEIVLVPGNRDFLAGAELERATGLRVAGEVLVVELGGRRVALLHGDELCAGDVGYLAFRRVVRAPALRRLARRLPPAWLHAAARLLRRLSQRLGAARAARGAGDVRAARAISRAAAARLLARTRAQAAVCGHTHRPERVDLPGAHALFVLGAWEENPSVYLEFADGEFRWRAWA